MKTELLDCWGDDLTVVNNARVSFDKESEWDRDCVCGERICQAEFCYSEYVVSDKDYKLIRYLARHKHWTPFANGIGARFRIQAPIPIMRQLFKHKIGSVESEVSRRYVTKGPEWFIPEFRRAAENVKQGSSDEIHPYNQEYRIAFEALISDCETFYDEMLAYGICPEQARMILPQAMESEAIISNSLYGWANVYNQRTDPNAQKEIRDLVQEIGKVMAELYPASWEALTGTP